MRHATLLTLFILVPPALAVGSNDIQAGSADALLAERDRAVVACATAGVSRAPAVAEDRFLLAIGEPQRFGTQPGADGKPALPVADGVPEALRADFLVPPLLRARHLGVEAATSSALPAMTQRLAARTGEGARDTDASRRLADLARKGEGRSLPPLVRDEVIDLLKADRVRHADDFANAARILLRARNADDLTLAHELATAAACRGADGALALFARTWDRAAVESGREPRYGTTPGAAGMAPSVPEELRAALASEAPIARGGSSGSSHAP